MYCSFLKCQSNISSEISLGYSICRGNCCGLLHYHSPHNDHSSHWNSWMSLFDLPYVHASCVCPSSLLRHTQAWFLGMCSLCLPWLHITLLLCAAPRAVLGDWELAHSCGSHFPVSWSGSLAQFVNSLHNRSANAAEGYMLLLTVYF